MEEESSADQERISNVPRSQKISLSIHRRSPSEIDSGSGSGSASCSVTKPEEGEVEICDHVDMEKIRKTFLGPKKGSFMMFETVVDVVSSSSNGIVSASTTSRNIRVGDIPEFFSFPDGSLRPVGQTVPVNLLNVLNSILTHPDLLEYERNLFLSGVNVSHTTARRVLEKQASRRVLQRKQPSTSLRTLQSSRTTNNTVDFRAFMNRPSHQGPTNDCTSHAVKNGFHITWLAYEIFSQSNQRQNGIVTAYSTLSSPSSAFRQEVEANQPSVMAINYDHKRYWGPCFPLINIASQWTYGTYYCALSAALSGVPLEMHFSYPRVYELKFDEKQITQDDLFEWYAKFFQGPDATISQFAENGMYTDWKIVPVLFSEETPASNTLSRQRSTEDRIALYEMFLLAGHPIVLSVPVFEHFRPFSESVYPDIQSNSRYAGFDHSVCIVGYYRPATGSTRQPISSQSYFIVRDSYGEDLGEKGYWYLPYTVFDSMLRVAPRMGSQAVSFFSPTDRSPYFSNET